MTMTEAMSGPTSDGFHSSAVRKETLQSLSLVDPHLRDTDTILDIGCGSGYLTWAIAERRPQARILAVDIVDARKKPTPHFALYDGVKLPFDDGSCDAVMLNFVLHHVPNETKPAVLAEVRRVCRRTLLVMEDTPRNFVDRYFNNRHGETFRRSINSTAGYGFYSQPEWEGIFREAGFAVQESTRLGRFSRYWRQPYARSFFALTPT
jgi:ubiquinone/menaquinone biosynthesis C-methylase UbiE